VAVAAATDVAAAVANQGALAAAAVDVEMVAVVAVVAAFLAENKSIHFEGPPQRA
jgi:hypothetical protein